jgi:hypothetical protein
MKTQIFAALVSFFLLGTSAQAMNPASCNPEVKVVVRASRIWILTDETPGVNLVIRIHDSRDQVVLEKELKAACTDWSINTETLPAGRYTVMLGTEKVGKFQK